MCIHVMIPPTVYISIDAGAEDLEPMYSRVLLIKRLDESDIPLYSPVKEKTSFNQLQGLVYTLVH